MINGPRMAMEVHMPGAVMIMLMHVPSFFNQLHTQQTAQDNEHDTNAKLRGG